MKETFQQSPNLVQRKTKDGILVYNSLFGYPIVLNKPAYRLLQLFKRPKTLEQISQSFEIEGLPDWTKLMVKKRLIIPLGTDERKTVGEMVRRGVKRISSGKKLISLGLILDEGCNFDCTYCLSKKMISASKRTIPEGMAMSWPTAKNAVDRFIAYLISKEQSKAEIYFGGSEPFLQWELIKRVVGYALTTYGDQLEFTFSTNTNLALIDAEKAQFLSDHRFMVTSSLDGPKEVNDRVRVYASGQGTYRQIIEGWDTYTEGCQPIEWFCLTVTDRNIDGIDEGFFDFMTERGIKSCSFEPDIINPIPRDPQEVVERLLTFKKMGKERNITVGGMWDKPAKNLFEPNIHKRMFDCSAFTGRGITVTPLGDIVPCSYSGAKLGTIDELDKLFDSERFQSYISSRAIGNIPACVGCEIEGQCMGGCVITQEYGEYTGSQDAFNYRCEIYKLATQALVETAITD